MKKTIRDKIVSLEKKLETLKSKYEDEIGHYDRCVNDCKEAWYLERFAYLRDEIEIAEAIERLQKVGFVK